FIPVRREGSRQAEKLLVASQNRLAEESDLKTIVVNIELLFHLVPTALEDPG
ncbi:hypothetical protein HKBW3S44_01600, partial [Candidatus Hakubella thermalkaliphila]